MRFACAKELLCKEKVGRASDFNIERGSFSNSYGMSYIHDQLAALKFSHHWQAKEIIVEATPAQDAVIDGETAGETPCQIKTIPSAVRILVPDA